MQDIANAEQEQQETSQISINDIFPEYLEWYNAYIKNCIEYRSIIEINDDVRQYHETVLKWCY